MAITNTLSRLFLHKSRIILLMSMLILLCPFAYAVWDDTTGVVWVSDGQLVSIGEHTIKLIDASIDEGVPFIEIRHKSNVIYKGFIEIDKPAVAKDDIYVEYLGSSQRFHYGAQIKIRAYEWVDGKITSFRFPRYMNRETFYNAWLEVENTGTKDAVFRTELTQAGTYDAKSGRYILPDGTSQAILLDLQFPVQDVRVPYGITERVAYNYVAPNRKQQSLLGDEQVRSGNSIEKTATVLYKLYFKNQLLDEVQIPNVGYGKSPSGYIDDMDLPDVMVRNELYECKATITNAGPGGNNIDTGKLNLQLITKGFTLGLSSNKLKKTSELQVSEDLLRKGMLTAEKNDWRFTISPNTPAGEYILEFKLWQNRHDYLYSTYDVFTKKVTVLDNFNKLISGMVMPPSVQVGTQIPLQVTLNNVGLGKLLNVNVRAPTLLDGPVKRVITIPADSSIALDYQIPAMVSGTAPITVEVYTHKASNYKWNDPYAESGYALDSLTKNVEVTDLEEGPSLPPLPIEQLPPQPGRSGVPVPASTVTSTVTTIQKTEVPTTGQATASVPEEKKNKQSVFVPQLLPTVQPAMILLIVLIVVVVLLAARVLINHYNRKEQLEAHESVSTHIKKGRR